MYVAKSRQKPAENAFEKRARLKTEAAEAKAAAAAPAPAAPLEPKPDAEALAKAAVPFDRNPASEEYTQAPDIATVEPQKGKRGRKPDPAVQERNARVLEAVVKAGPVAFRSRTLPRS